MRVSRVSNDQKSTEENKQCCRRVERKQYEESEGWSRKEKMRNTFAVFSYIPLPYSFFFVLPSCLQGIFAQFISLTGKGGVFSTIFKRNSAKVKTRLKLHWRRPHKTPKNTHTSLCLKLTPIIRGGSFVAPQTPVNFLGMHFKSV